MIAKRILSPADAKRRGLTADEDPTYELAQEICALARGDYIRACSHLGLEHWAFSWFADLTDGFTKGRKDRVWAEVKKHMHVWPNPLPVGV